MKLDIVRITEEEKNEFLPALVDAYHKDGLVLTQEIIEKKVKEIENQTLMVVNQIKMAHKWNDIEDIVDFVSIIKRVNSEADSIELSQKEADLVRKICKAVAKDKGFTGLGLEKFADFYRQFTD